MGPERDTGKREVKVTTPPFRDLTSDEQSSAVVDTSLSACKGSGQNALMEVAAIRSGNKFPFIVRNSHLSTLTEGKYRVLNSL